MCIYFGQLIGLVANLQDSDEIDAKGVRRVIIDGIDITFVRSEVRPDDEKMGV